MWLTDTPYMFGTISIHAFYKGRCVVGLLWLLQGWSSCRSYCYGNENSVTRYNQFMRNRLFENVNWIYALWRAVCLSPASVWSWIVWISLLYTFAVYYLILSQVNIYSYYLSYNPIIVRAHRSLNITSAIGIHALLLADILPSTMAC